VLASLPDPGSADRYVAWLQGGHVREVVAAGGAISATISRVLETATSNPPPNRVESRYVFPDREAFERYVALHAPRLREEGLRLFPPSCGVVFERRLAEVVADL